LTFPNTVEVIQFLQPAPNISHSHLPDSQAVVSRNLPVNFPDLATPKPTVGFEHPQKVTGLHRNMLAHIAHQEDTHVVRVRQPEQFRSLTV
jgi:hypothetical protein